MSIDFSEIKDWRQFEDLICDLLEKEGFYIEQRAGIGSDEGRDILSVGYFANSLERIERRYLVSCKYWKKAVPESKVTDIRDKMRQHKAQGFLLAAMKITSGLQKKLDGMKGEELIVYWIRRDIENLLRKHKDVFRKHLPSSFEKCFGVKGLIPEIELILFFNKKYRRNPTRDELISWRKDTVNHGITDIRTIEQILDDQVILESLNRLYGNLLNRSVDPVGHLTFGYILHTLKREAAEKVIEINIKNSDEYLSKTRVDYYPKGLPNAEIHFNGIPPQEFYGWRPYHVAYAKGVLRVMSDSFPPYVELESNRSEEFRIQWSLGRLVQNKNRVAVEVTRDDFFQFFILVVGSDDRQYFVQYRFEDGEPQKIKDNGVDYAQYFVGGTFALNGPNFVTLERNFSQDLSQLYDVMAVAVAGLFFGVKGKAKIARILLAE